MGRKILVAFDDSENAMRAVEYVAQVFSGDHEITLFNVIPDTAAICDMNSPELTPHFLVQQQNFCVFEEKKKELVKDALEKAKAILLNGRFEEGKIRVKIVPKKKGIARDIVNEAKTGYDTIVLGRRGLTGIEEFLLGSISQKVFNLAKDFSVLLVN